MTLVNSTGKIAAFYYATGTNSYSNDAMEEVDLSSEGYPRYTVYEMSTANAAKRYARDDVAIVFQHDGGSGSWVTLTPAVVQYAGCRIFLSTALTAGHAVRVASGSYYTVTQCLGASDWQLDLSWVTEKAMKLGDQVPSACLLYKEWKATVGAYWPLTQASLTTSGGNANSHVTLTHEPGGSGGNAIDLVLVDPAALNTDEIVSVTGNTITVTLASTAVPAITTTALQLVEALSGSDAVRGLGVTAKLAGAETGVGVVAALAHPDGHLIGGLDGTDMLAPTAKIVAVFYDNYSGDRRYEGFAAMRSNSISLDPGKLIKQSLTLESCGSPLYYRES